MSKLDLFLRNLWWMFLLRPLDWAAGRASQPSGERTDVLVVRLDRLGDMVLWLESAGELRRMYPRGQYRMILLASRGWAELARRNLDFDDVWELDRRRFVLNPWYRYRLLRRVRLHGFVLALHATYSRDFLWGDAAIKATHARQRVGLVAKGDLMTRGQQRRSDGWYTRLIPVSPGDAMELRRNAEFVRGLGRSSFRAGLPALCPAPASLPTVRTPYYVIAPGASHALRRWEAAKFAALAARIHAATGWVGVICGDSNDRALANGMLEAGCSPLWDLTGRTSLPKLASVLAGARLVIGNESGIVHLASAVGTRAICVMGGGHYGRFLPYEPEADCDRIPPRVVSLQLACFGCNWRCRYPYRSGDAAPCISNISLDSVWAAALDAIRSTSDISSVADI